LELLELTYSRYESLVLVDFLQYDLDPINIYRVMPDALGRLDRARQDPVAAILAGRDAGLGRCVTREFPAEAAAPAEGDVAPLTRALLLRRTQAFRSLSLEELAALGAGASEVDLDSGGLVFRAGQPGDALYVVVRGTVHLQREGQDLAWLGPGDCLGEAAVVDGEPYPCDAEAEPGTALLRIDAAALAEALPGHPRLVRGLLRHLASVIPAEDRPAA
jgi:hypothetical protein